MIGQSNDTPDDDIEFRAKLTLQRLQPRIDQRWEESQDSEARTLFDRRVSEQWKPLFALLYRLYGDRYDFFYHLEQTQQHLNRYLQLQVLKCPLLAQMLKDQLFL